MLKKKIKSQTQKFHVQKFMSTKGLLKSKEGSKLLLLIVFIL